MGFNQSIMYGGSAGYAAGRRGFGVGSLDGLAGIALGRERDALVQAQGQAQQQAQAMTAQGANAFGAQRQAQVGMIQQQAGIRAQTDSQLAQLAERERQIQEEERRRKEQQAQQMLAGGLSTAGAVIGTMMGPLGSTAGGGLGGGLGSALGGLFGGGGQRPPQPGQPQQLPPSSVAAPAPGPGQKPAMGLSPSSVYAAPRAPFAGLPGALDERLLFGGR